jgi:hypothetical protein
MVKEIQVAIPEGSVGRRAALIHVSTRSVNGRCGRSVHIPSILEADLVSVEIIPAFAFQTGSKITLTAACAA